MVAASLPLDLFLLNACPLSEVPDQLPCRVAVRQGQVPPLPLFFRLRVFVRGDQRTDFWLRTPPPLMARKGVATPSAAALLLRVTPSARCLLQDDRTQPSLRPPVPSLLPDLAPNYPSPKFPPGTLTCFSVYFNLPRPTTALWLALPVYTWSPTFLGTPTYTTVYFHFPLPAL